MQKYKDLYKWNVLFILVSLGERMASSVFFPHFSALYFHVFSLHLHTTTPPLTTPSPDIQYLLC